MPALVLAPAGLVPRPIAPVLFRVLSALIAAVAYFGLAGLSFALAFAAAAALGLLGVCRLSWATSYLGRASPVPPEETVGRNESPESPRQMCAPTACPWRCARRIATRIVAFGIVCPPLRRGPWPRTSCNRRSRRPLCRIAGGSAPSRTVSMLFGSHSFSSTVWSSSPTTLARRPPPRYGGRGK